MEWVKDKNYTNVWITTKKFNGYQYNVIVIPDITDKTIKYWIHASSGKKRREFEIFEDKKNKSFGGIRALFFIRDAMYDFPKYFRNTSNIEGKKEYLMIGWADSRRRDIYQRLEKEGFQFMMDGGNKILMKKL